MEFIKYNHIENIQNKIDQVRKQLVLFDAIDVEWVATEKLDGANFQFITDGTDIKCASRTRILDGSYEFYGYQDVLAKYKQSVLDVYGMVKDMSGMSTITVRLFGEIFGGYYPDNTSGKDIDKLRRGAPRSAVQKRVLYMEQVDFYLFDVCYDLPGGQQKYLNVDDVVRCGKTCGFVYTVEALHRGSLEEMLALSPEFDTTIPQQAGLKPIRGNKSEGYVVRTSRVLSRVAMHGGTHYLNLKLKHKAEAFRESVPLDELKQRNKAAKAGKVKLTEDEAVIHEEVLAGLTLSRMYSVASKWTPAELQAMNVNRVASMLVIDALEELETDRDDLEPVLSQLDKDAIKKVKTSVMTSALVVVQEYIESEKDDNFESGDIKQGDQAKSHSSGLKNIGRKKIKNVDNNTNSDIVIENKSSWIRLSVLLVIAIAILVAILFQ